MPARYLIGIDLGTTNSVVAYIDTQAAADVGSTIHVFAVPQLVAHGEVRTLPALPSFLYFPTEEELSARAVSATWDEDPRANRELWYRADKFRQPNRGSLIPA